MENYFIENFNQKVESNYVDHKGKFSYLRWAKAVELIKSKDPATQINIKRFDNVPFLKTELGYFVEVEVICFGVNHSVLMPILDNRNQPINKPNTFDINTSIQRATVKAIAYHGIGLKIYQGEVLDMLEEKKVDQKKETERNLNKEKKEAVKEINACNNIDEVEIVIEKYSQFANEKKFLEIAGDKTKQILDIENFTRNIKSIKSVIDLDQLKADYPRIQELEQIKKIVFNKLRSFNDDNGLLMESAIKDSKKVNV